MKITIDEKKKSDEITFPRLMTYKNSKTIVLVFQKSNNICKGVCLSKDEKEQIAIGECYDVWNPEMIPFDGKITLEN